MIKTSTLAFQLGARRSSSRKSLESDCKSLKTGVMMASLSITSSQPKMQICPQGSPDETTRQANRPTYGIVCRYDGNRELIGGTIVDFFRSRRLDHSDNEGRYLQRAAVLRLQFLLLSSLSFEGNNFLRLSPA